MGAKIYKYLTRKKISRKSIFISFGQFGNNSDECTVLVAKSLVVVLQVFQLLKNRENFD
jgi:hypothetical protein